MRWTTLYRRLEDSGSPFVMITVVEVRGSAPREAGARCFVAETGRLEGTIGGGTLEEEARLTALDLLGRHDLAEPRTATLIKTYELDEVLSQCCGGRVRLLYEVVHPAPELLLFGAGHVGLALARVLAESRLAVTVIDPRPEFADPRRFPSCVEVIAADPLALIPELVFSASRTHVVVMTHSHCLDQRILEAVVPRATRYVGLIGSRAKWARFRKALVEGGLDPGAVDRVQCPMGIPLGDKRPAEVAVSIAAEILAGLPRTSKGLDAKARSVKAAAVSPPR
jgi:xanthine dehydrogenase accessory factor